jgi:hypothetical protein
MTHSHTAHRKKTVWMCHHTTHHLIASNALSRVIQFSCAARFPHLLELADGHKYSYSRNWGIGGILASQQ